MWTMLANIATPLFAVGIGVAGIGLAIAAILWLASSSDQEMSDGWIIKMKGIKRGVTAVIVGTAMIVLSFAVEDADEPYIKYVEKEVKVPALPDFERLVNKCYADTVEGKSLGTDDRLAVRSNCLEIANDQYRVITKGPVRVVEIEKPKFAKIPFKQFMEDCGARGKATGKVAIEARTAVHNQCLEAAGTHFRGLVARNK